MEVPRFDKLISPTLVALHALGGSATIDEITQRVILDLSLPDKVVDVPHSRGNRTKLEYRLAWARTYLKKYGLIKNSDRGVWALTPEGQKRQSVDNREVVNTVKRSSGDQATSSVTVLEEDEALPEEETWRAELMETLLRMRPDAFEVQLGPAFIPEGNTDSKQRGRLSTF